MRKLKILLVIAGMTMMTTSCTALAYDCLVTGWCY